MRKEEIGKLNTGLSAAEISKVCGKEWATLTKDDKRRYEEISKMEKEEYRRKVAEADDTGNTHRVGNVGVVQKEHRKQNESLETAESANDAGIEVLGCDNGEGSSEVQVSG